MNIRIVVLFKEEKKRRISINFRKIKLERGNNINTFMKPTFLHNFLLVY